MTPKNLNITFWEPINFEYAPPPKDRRSQSTFSKYAWKIGNFVDHLASYQWENIKHIRVRWKKGEEIRDKNDPSKVIDTKYQIYFDQKKSTDKSYINIVIKISVLAFALYQLAVPTMVCTSAILLIKHIYKSTIQSLIEDFKLDLELNRDIKIMQLQQENRILTEENLKLKIMLNNSPEKKSTMETKGKRQSDFNLRDFRRNDFFNFSSSSDVRMKEKVPYEKTRSVICERVVGNNCKIELIYGDLTKEKSDAIVNPANDALLELGGVCGAIGRVSGKQPFDECECFLKAKKQFILPCGEAMITTSGNMKDVKYIIHAVGPNFARKEQKDNGWPLLTNAWLNSLKLAFDPKNKSEFMSPIVVLEEPLNILSAPSISTGIYRANVVPDKNDPTGKCAPVVALETIIKFFEDNKLTVKDKVVRIVFIKERSNDLDDNNKSQNIDDGSLYKSALEKLIPLEDSKKEEANSKEKTNPEKAEDPKKEAAATGAAAGDSPEENPTKKT